MIDLHAKAARAREGQQDAAVAHQRAVGRVIARVESMMRYASDKHIIAALTEAGITTSRGNPWTPETLQSTRGRIRARCRADPAFAAEEAMWRAQALQEAPQPPTVATQAHTPPRDHEAEARAAKAAADAHWRAQCDATAMEQQARVDARLQAARLAREARRAIKTPESIAADIRRTTMGTAAAADVARAARARLWPEVAALLAQGRSLTETAAELNRRGVERVRGGQGWTRADVGRLMKSVRDHDGQLPSSAPV